jgi:hypothetical protein
MLQLEGIGGQEHCIKSSGSLDLAGDYGSVQESQEGVAIQVKPLVQLVLDGQELQRCSTDGKHASASFDWASTKNTSIHELLHGGLHQGFEL